MQIISYNVNGIRAAATKGLFEWLESVSPDVFCIQESKAQPEQIPVERLTEMGYHSYIHSADFITTRNKAIKYSFKCISPSIFPFKFKC